MNHASGYKRTVRCDHYRERAYCAYPGYAGFNGSVWTEVVKGVSMTVRVLVVDDSRFFRRRVTEILNSDARLDVIGAAENGLEAVEMVARLQVGRLLLTLDPENQIFTETEVANIAFFDKIINYHMHAICTDKRIKYYYKQLNKIKNEDQN